MVEFRDLVGLEPVGFVEQDGAGGVGVEADFAAHDVRDGERVLDEGMAVAAHLALQRLVGRFIGREHQFLLPIGQIGQQVLQFSG